MPGAADYLALADRFEALGLEGGSPSTTTVTMRRGGSSASSTCGTTAVGSCTWPQRCRSSASSNPAARRQSWRRSFGVARSVCRQHARDGRRLCWPSAARGCRMVQRVPPAVSASPRGPAGAAGRAWPARAASGEQVERNVLLGRVAPQPSSTTRTSADDSTQRGTRLSLTLRSRRLARLAG